MEEGQVKQKILKLEDFKVWQEAKILCYWSDQVVDTFPRKEEFCLKKHMRENNRNIPSNIGEGFYRYYFKEKIFFYDVALGCLGELKSDYYIAFGRRYTDEIILNKFINQIDKVIRMLYGSIGSARNQLRKD